VPPELQDGWTIDRELFDWGYESEPHAGEEVKPVRRKRLLGGTSWLTRFTPRGEPAGRDGLAMACAISRPVWRAVSSAR
jgi:hypothetical protein